MAPKKIVSASKVKEEAPVATAETQAIKAPKPTKLKTLVHPSTLSMVVEVLKKNSERKGTSVHSIRTKILAAHPTVDPVRLKFLLRSALNKGLEKGILVRPPKSSAIGATGRFKLAKPLPKAKDGSGSATSENLDPNTHSKEKPKKKVVKKAKATESKDEKPKKADTSSKKEKASEEKPKASKPKKDAEMSNGLAAAKKPKAKKADGDTKSKKGPTDKAEPKKAKKTVDKAETKKENGIAETKKENGMPDKGAKKENGMADKETKKGTTKALKDSVESGTAKTSKKPKK
ncbi:histone H1.8 [Mantella aurantiaca]